MPSDEVHEKMPAAHIEHALDHMSSTDAAIHSAIAEPRQLTLSDIAADSPFAVEAFAFLQRGLARTVENAHGDVEDDSPHHVHGRDLCLGLRDLALEEYGMLAGIVLGSWNVHKTADFGEMVYQLVAYDVLAVSSNDRPEDFDNVFDFNAAF